MTNQGLCKECPHHLVELFSDGLLDWGQGVLDQVLRERGAGALGPCVLVRGQVLRERGAGAPVP